jgi:hypothetical protein
MDMHKVLVGGERSAGKTTLMNLLISGKTTDPFPRGIKGRSSKLNTAWFNHTDASREGEINQTLIRVSTSGLNSKQIDLQTSSPECTDILLSAVRDLTLNLLDGTLYENRTSISLEIHANGKAPFGLISEICADALADFANGDSHSKQGAVSSMPLPKIYIHLTPAIKPLAHVERQAVVKFLSLNIPVILLVSRCDLITSEEDFNEISSLVHIFSSKDCRNRLPYYMVSLAANESPPGDAIIGARDTRDLILHALTLDLDEEF